MAKIKSIQVNKVLINITIYVAVLFIFASFITPVHALFVIEDGSTNSLSAGSLINNMSTTDPMYSVDASLLPGESYTQVFTIENAGESNFDYDIRASSLSGSLCSSLDIEINENGSENAPLVDLGLDTFFQSGGFDSDNLSTSSSKEYVIKVSVKENANPSLSGASCDFDLNVMSWGEDSEYGTGFYDVSSESNSLSTGDWHGRSEYTNWHYQALGEVVDEDTTLTSYSYWYTAAEEFYPSKNEGLLINEYTCDPLTESCSGISITFNKSEKFSVYNETLGSMFCVSDSALNTTLGILAPICDHASDAKVENMNARNMYKVTYYWESGNAPVLKEDRYYIAKIGSSSRKSAIKGGDLGNGAKKSNGDVMFSQASSDTFISQLDICLNDSICGQFPLEQDDDDNISACTIVETITVGDREQDGLSNPFDEFNVSDPNNPESVNTNKPPYDSPFDLSSTIDAKNWPWNSKAGVYADNFNVTYDHDGSFDAKGLLTLGWGPGKSGGTETKEVYVNSEFISGFSANSSSIGAYGPLLKQTTKGFELITNKNELNLRHTAGDGSYWDFIELKVLNCNSD